MRKSKALAIVIAFGLGLVFLYPFAAQAKPKKGGGDHESQAGGLPALEDRLELSEAAILEIEADLGELQAQITALQGQNNFACVAADGTLGIHSASVTGSDNFATGEYEVEFSKDVHLCAPVATIGTNLTASTTIPIGFISVAGDPTLADDSVGDGADSDGILVQTANTSGTLTSLAFCLYVTCP